MMQAHLPPRRTPASMCHRSAAAGLHGRRRITRFELLHAKGEAMAEEQTVEKAV